MKIEILERLIITSLRTGLATVRTSVGAPEKWIYVDYPRLDATMPRISVTLTSSIETPAAVGAEMGGTLGVYEETSFDIDIWVHRTNKTTGLTPARGGTALRDYLADEVVDIILALRATLASTYPEIIDIQKVGESPHPYDEETELFRKTLTITVTHLRTY